MKHIRKNDELTVRFIGDSELRPKIKVVDRRGSFVKLQVSENEIVRRKVFSDMNKEFVFPFGKYSMSPIAY